MSWFESAAKKRCVGLARRDPGFSLIELMIVVTIVMVVSAFAAPRVITMVHTSRLRGSAADVESLIQVDRIRAVQDDKFYPIYVSGTGTGGASVFVDLAGTGTFANGDPEINFASEVQAVAQANAPSTTALYNLFLPPGSTVTALDGTDTSSGFNIKFSSRGLPCKSQTPASGGKVCDSAGGAIPYWIFLQNISTQEYMAVTVNPAGRIRKWYYTNGVWGGM